MAHDFAKTRRRAAPEQARNKPVAPPPARNLLVTGLITGAVLGFFSFFLIYLSGILPPVGNMTAEAVASNEAELAAAQQRRNEELEAAAARLQLEFYKELPNYELIVDNMPQASAATTLATTGAQLSAAVSTQAVAPLDATAQTVDIPPPATAAAVTAPVAVVDAGIAAAATATGTGTPAAVAPTADPGPARDAGFMLQAGAFQQESSAVAQSDRLLSLGLFSRVRQEALLGKTLFLVQVGPFDNREQVAQAESILRSNGIDSIRMGLSQ
jgi:cell division protein FtsN